MLGVFHSNSNPCFSSVLYRLENDEELLLIPVASSAALSSQDKSKLERSGWRFGTAVSTMRSSSRPRVFRKVCESDG